MHYRRRLILKCRETYRTAVANKNYSVFMVTPRRFLIHADHPGLSALIKPRFNTALGVVTELGHSRTRIRIQGPKARALLSRGVAIDLDSSAFPVGDFAQCAIHHMGLLLHHISSEEENGTYVVYVLRSFAVSFWHWLTSSTVLLRS